MLGFLNNQLFNPIKEEIFFRKKFNRSIFENFLFKGNLNFYRSNIEAKKFYRKPTLNFIMCTKNNFFEPNELYTTNDNKIGKDLSGDMGVIKEILKEGNNNQPQENSIVKVRYKGFLENGEIFDDFFNQNEPYIFAIGEKKVIRGWEIAIKTMKEGEKAKLIISSEYGYKKKGIPPIIPPNAKLFFEIELLEIINKSNNFEKIGNEFTIETPRTPKKIAKEFEKKILKKNELETKKKFEDFFFISLFQSQNGKKAPWWLDPNVTFFLVFFLMTLLFYIVFLAGGIHQGYID
jgi:hypothetical protein